jgi:hypothetical protein
MTTDIELCLDVRPGDPWFAPILQSARSVPGHRDNVLTRQVVKCQTELLKPFSTMLRNSWAGEHVAPGFIVTENNHIRQGWPGDVVFEVALFLINQAN